MDKDVRRTGVRARARRGAEPWWRIAERYGIVSVQTRPGPVPDDDRSHGIAGPLPNGALNAVIEHCEPRADVQLIISRGRTDAALRRALPVVLPELLDGSATRGLSVGRPIAVRPYRPGTVKVIARVLEPRVVVLITAGWRMRARTAHLSALVAVSPEWDARPACRLRLCGERGRRAGILRARPSAGGSQTVSLVLDVAYALAASPGRPAGTLLDATTRKPEGDRPQWNPDGLPETGH